jgi:uncharacterized RDD family membrane protein YckC
MQTIQVRTTQNVFIDYPIAGLFDRILAFILDMLIFIAYLLIASAFLGVFKLLDKWSLILIYLPVFFYNLIFEIAMNGQTPGKKALNIRVVRLDGNSPTIANYILRWILWPIDISLFGSIAITFILLTRNGQRLGDLAGGTTLIKMTQRESVKGQEIIQTLKEDYEPQFPQVVHLTDKDVALIKEALAVNIQLGITRPMEIISDKIRSMHGIQSDLPVLTFLNTVLKDYHHLTSGA